MIKDFRYVIKKILIGIGIIIGVSMIRSCKVSALSNDIIYPMKKFQTSTGRITHTVGDKYTYRINDNFYEIEYKSDGLYVNNNQAIASSVSRWLTAEWFMYYSSGSNHILFISIPQVNSESTYFTINSVYSDVQSNNSEVLNNAIQDYPITINRIYRSSSFKYNRLDFDFDTGQYVSSSQNNNASYSNDWNYILFNGSNMVLYGASVKYNQNVNNYSLSSYSSSCTYCKNYISTDFDYVPNLEPEIVSLNPVLNKTEDNMLVSVSFTLEFSFVDTENYNYYAWFDGYQKLKLTENNVQLNTQNNTTLFVEITDSDNNYITSQTYTVSSIGLVYGGDYDIQFSTNEYSQSDIDNNTDNIFNTIDRISIDILYIPKWINYKYQYQFVPENGSLTDNWVLVNDNNAENNVVYNTRVNGKMYARILDMEDNVIYSEDYSITRIGELKIYDKNVDQFYGHLNIIKEHLNFGGPISDLIVIPVNVLKSIADASNKVCTPYDFGTLWGHRIVFPCIEPEHYLGSALWTTIDLIFSGCMFYAISKWFTSAYYKFILLENTPGIKGRRDL